MPTPSTNCQACAAGPIQPGVGSSASGDAADGQRRAQRQAAVRPLSPRCTQASLRSSSTLGDEDEQHHRPPGDAVERLHHRRREDGAVGLGEGRAPSRPGPSTMPVEDLVTTTSGAEYSVRPKPDPVGYRKDQRHRDGNSSEWSGGGPRAGGRARARGAILAEGPKGPGSRKAPLGPLMLRCPGATSDSPLNEELRHAPLLLWIAKTGMEGQQTRLDQISNNLANVGPPTASSAARRVRGPDVPEPAPGRRPPRSRPSRPPACRPAWAAHAGTTRSFTQGNLQADRQQPTTWPSRATAFPDPAARRHHWLHARRRRSRSTPPGQLVTNSGYVQQPGITIPATALSVTVGADGTVRSPPGPPPRPQTVGQIQLASFVNPAGWSRAAETSSETAAAASPNAAAPQQRPGLAAQGFVETSNVNVVEDW